jgi:hypothetical protein
MILMSFPIVVSHHIDVYSLLHPPVPSLPVEPNGLVLRQADSINSGREECSCPICGEAYGFFERLVDHVRYNQMIETKDKFPREGTHLSIDDRFLEKEEYPITDIEILKKHFTEEISEIIVVAEGIDPIMSGTFQALHSYKVEDIVWEADAEFVPCVGVDDVDRTSLRVDLDKFHLVHTKSVNGTK